MFTRKIPFYMKDIVVEKEDDSNDVEDGNDVEDVNDVDLTDVNDLELPK